MAISDFYPPSVLKYRDDAKNKHAFEDSAPERVHLSGQACLILCTLAETPAMSHDEILKKSGLRDLEVKAACGVLLREQLICTKDPDKETSFRKLQLTDAGRMKHKEILGKG